jgi:hypothetical protein
LAVVATLSKGYDLDYIWRQVDRGPARDAASYYIQASESGGEPPGRWWGPGARALGLEPGQVVEREPYDLLFGGRKAPDGTPLGRPPGSGRKAADVYAWLLAAEPHATAERKGELRLEATRQARQDPLFFDLTLSLSKSIFRASLGENARLASEAEYARRQLGTSPRIRCSTGKPSGWTARSGWRHAGLRERTVKGRAAGWFTYRAMTTASWSLPDSASALRPTGTARGPSRLWMCRFRSGK